MAKGNSIASANVLIAANADQLNSGLNKAGKDVQNWGKDVGAKGGKGMFGGMSGAIGAMGKAGPYAAAAAVGVTGLVIGLKEVGETLIDIGKQGDIAEAMGLSAEQFTGMAGVAKSVGEDTREFIESLVTMGKLGTDAAKGTEAAADAFKMMGLNADEFIKLRADEQFFKVFESISKMTDPLQKTRVLMAAFGEDGGKYLLPLLKKTPEELRKMAAGFAVTTEEMKKTQAATVAMKSVEMSLGKLWRTAAIGLAPVLEGIAKFAIQAIELGKPFFDWFMRAWGAIQEVAIPFFDMLDQEVTTLWKDIKDGFGDSFSWVGELPTIRDVIIATFRIVGTAIAGVWDMIKVGAGAVAIGLGGVAKGLGMLAKEIPGFEEMGARIEKAGEDMGKWGQGAVNGMGGSAAKFNTWLDGVLAKKDKLTAPISAIAGAENAIKSDPIKLGGVFAKGTAEAYSLIVGNRYGTNQGDIAKKQLKAQEGIKKNGDKANIELGGIKEALQGFGGI